MEGEHLTLTYDCKIGVQNSRSKIEGLYAVGPVGFEMLISHIRYEAGPFLNDGLHKLGARTSRKPT